MWELVSFFGGMLVLVLFVVLLPLMFDLPDAITKYLSRKASPSAGTAPPADPDEAAARLLGESLSTAEASPQSVAQVTAAFWVADARNRRALAQLVAGLSASGAVEDTVLLAVLRNLPEPPSGRADRSPPSTDFRELPANPG